MFRAVPLSIIRSFSLYTQQCGLLPNCQQTFMTYTIAMFTVKTPDDGQRNCPKHVEFYSKNKFEKSVHLVGFITTDMKFRVSRDQHTWFEGLFSYLVRKSY